VNLYELLLLIWFQINKFDKFRESLRKINCYIVYKQTICAILLLLTGGKDDAVYNSNCCCLKCEEWVNEQSLVFHLELHDVKNVCSCWITCRKWTFVMIDLYATQWSTCRPFICYWLLHFSQFIFYHGFCFNHCLPLNCVHCLSDGILWQLPYVITICYYSFNM
jgi:hypothetical protein